MKTFNTIGQILSRDKVLNKIWINKFGKLNNFKVYNIDWFRFEDGVKVIYELKYRKNSITISKQEFESSFNEELREYKLECIGI